MYLIKLILPPHKGQGQIVVTIHLYLVYIDIGSDHILSLGKAIVNHIKAVRISNGS